MRISFMLIAMLFWSCNTGTVYQSFVAIENDWSVFEPVNFQVNIDQIEASYEVTLSLRHTRTYPYNNIYLRYQMTDNEGNQVIEKLEEIALFVPKTGKPLGSGLGDVYDIDHLILKNYKFNKTGNYQFVFTQFMRADSLAGIERLGLIIQKAKIVKD